MKMAILLIPFSLVFFGCSTKEIAVCKVPKLRTCIVSKKEIKVRRVGDEICMKIDSYKILKRQNYRLRVCNELLNNQNKDFNKRFAR